MLLRRARKFWMWRPVGEVRGNSTLDMVHTRRRACTWVTGGAKVAYARTHCPGN